MDWLYRMNYLIVNPHMFVFEYVRDKKTSKRVLLCEFAYVLCTDNALINQKGFPIKNELSMRELGFITEHTGISTGLATSRGRTFREAMQVLIDLLRTPKLSHIIIAEYDKFYSLVSRFKINDPVRCQLLRELNRVKVTKFNISELPNVTNIAICDCLAIYNKIVK